jgi:hypothetical protein
MDGNFENDLHSALDDMADGTIASGAVYSDVEGHRQNPELKMVMALKEMLDRPGDSPPDEDSAEAEEVPVITWTGEGPRVLMNDYKDAEYFTGAFPSTLFPYGIKGGHLPRADERHVPVSLEAWAKWLLSHHTRRCVLESDVVFMHLLTLTKVCASSDVHVFALRCHPTAEATLGNSMFVKRGDYEHVQVVISSLTHDQLLAAARSLHSTQTVADPAIRILRQAIQTVAAKVPNSFTRKQDMRLYIRAFFVEFGPAAFWLTLNPSDMRDPLVIKLAGMTFSSDFFSKSTATLRGRAAIMNSAKYNYVER